ncbi:MAG: ClpXP protease specificity-enhancing factor SspB [Aestuariivirga sp.]|jgi:uncharacterized protein
MPEDLMRYDQLAQNALRGVVREALRRVEKSGLPGDHHFYIAFNTKYPGVDIGERMSQRYPREMTIVIQHQYEHLIVREDRFEITLSFDNIPEKLVIPFNAVKGFLDPSVQFGLQFEVIAVETPIHGESKVEKLASGKKKPDGDGTTSPDEPPKDAPKVISLDSFRKK